MRAFATIFIGVGAAALLTAPLAAQNFNLDFDTSVIGAGGDGAPAATFGAAAGQPGTWNLMEGTTPLITLNNLNGSPSTVTFSRALSTGGNFAFNNAGTTGDTELLMDDGDDLSAGATPNVYTFTGLAAGTYQVFTYAWAPDVPTSDFTSVSVTGSSSTNPQIIGGAVITANALNQTQHYALHNVTIGVGGTLVITCDGQPGSFGTVNGIQIKQGGGSPCPANIVNTGTSVNKVDVDDLLAVISQWGPCPAPPAACPANIVTTGTIANKVDVDDLLAVIGQWGPCPTS